MFDDPGFIPAAVKAGQILACFGAGLLLARMRAAYWPRARLVGLIALICGLLAAPLLVSIRSVEIALLTIAMIGGAVIAAGYGRKRAGLILIGLAGLALGRASWPQDGTMPDKALLTGFNVIGTLLVVAGTAWAARYILTRTTEVWPGIGARIFGSWIFAISFLVLALGILVA